MRTPFLDMHRCFVCPVQNRSRSVVISGMLLVGGVLLVAGCGSSGGGDSATTANPTTPDPGVPTALTVSSITLIGTIAPIPSGHQVAVEVDGQPARLATDSWSMTIPYNGSVTTLRVVKLMDGVEVSSRLIDVSAQ